MIHLIFRNKHYYIQFGTSVFDGCAGVGSHAVDVNGLPGLLYVSDTPTASPWSELIWPATKANPQGIYGVSGSFGARQALAMARSMPAAGNEPKALASC